MSHLRFPRLNAVSIVINYSFLPFVAHLPLLFLLRFHSIPIYYHSIEYCCANHQLNAATAAAVAAIPHTPHADNGFPFTWILCWAMMLLLLLNMLIHSALHTTENYNNNTPNSKANTHKTIKTRMLMRCKVLQFGFSVFNINLHNTKSAPCP